MKKRLISLVIILVMAIGFMPTVTFAANTPEFAGGSGTEEDPYLIETKYHLDNVRNYLDAHFKMIADIEFTDADFTNGGSFYNNRNGFEPIGTRFVPFEGSFNGNGFSIKNLYIKKAGECVYAGLFGNSAGMIKNLALVDVDIYGRGYYMSPSYYGRAYIGAVAGYSSGEILNCCSFGSVYASSENPGTPVSGSYLKAEVYAGGIVGVNSGTIENCFNASYVSSYSAVQPDPAAGGIAGLSYSSISNSYNIGEISLRSTNGGIVGILRESGLTSGTTTNCYYLNTCGRGVGFGTDNCKQCDITDFKKLNTYSGFDFENVWTMDGYKCYPFPELKSVKITTNHFFETDCDIDCDCGYTRITEHKFDDSCDVKCNICGYVRKIEHTYNNSCDTKCNVCGSTRTITHSFGAYIYNKDATYEKDGTRTRVCSICNHKETIIAKGTKLEKLLINSSKIFKDVKSNAWYKEFVDYAVTYGIFSGTTANTFSPNDNITRAQFVQVLANLEGVDTSDRNVTTNFSDVPAKKWFTAAVKWASENKIVNGTGDGKFAPNANVTREQMCVMLTNYAKFKGITLKTVEGKENFADDNKISKWAKTAVYTCQQADIVNGKGAGKFDPQGTGTRAEASVIFTKFHKEYLTK